MIDKDDVISAAALAHCVPGAELLLRRTDGGRITVAGHSRADLSPCTFRHLVAEGPCPIATEVDTCSGWCTRSRGGRCVSLAIPPRGTLVCCIPHPGSVAKVVQRLGLRCASGG